MTTFCANHPSIETSLRCARCEKYICVKCAVKAPVGYRCRECVRELGKVFNTAEWYDYLIAFVVSAVLSGIASGLLSLLSFIGFFMYFLMITAAPIVGAIIASAVQKSVSKRRSKNLFITAASGVVIGALPISIGLFFFNPYALIAIGIYVIITAPVVYARLSGIEFRR